MIMHYNNPLIDFSGRGEKIRCHLDYIHVLIGKFYANKHENWSTSFQRNSLAFYQIYIYGVLLHFAPKLLK